MNLEISLGEFKVMKVNQVGKDKQMTVAEISTFGATFRVVIPERFKPEFVVGATLSIKARIVPGRKFFEPTIQIVGVAKV